MDGVKQVPSVHFAHSPLLLLCSRQLVLSLRFLLDTDKAPEYTTTSSRRFLEFSHHHRVCTTTTSIISLPDLPNLQHTCGKIRALSVGPEQAVASFSSACGTRRPCFPVPVLCAAVFFSQSLSSLLGFSGSRACLRVAVVFLPVLASVITNPGEDAAQAARTF